MTTTIVTNSAVLYADSPDFQESFPTFSGIVVWKDAKLVSRYSHGVITWSVRRLTNTVRYSVSATGEVGAYLFLANQEEFFDWIKENSPIDLEWLIWNLDAMDFT